MIATIVRLFHVITDWLLIALGLLLVLVALRAIDVPIVEYVVIAVGCIMIVAGGLSRYWRLKNARMR